MKAVVKRFGYEIVNDATGAIYAGDWCATERERNEMTNGLGPFADIHRVRFKDRDEKHPEIVRYV